MIPGMDGASASEVEEIFDEAQRQVTVQQRVRRARRDPVYFAETYLTKSCYRCNTSYRAVACPKCEAPSVPKFQADVLYAAAAASRFAWMGPVGHGKSFNFGFVLPLWRIANNVNTRIILASRSSARASDLSRQVKTEIERNDALREFGIEPDREKWTERQWQVKRSVNLKDTTVTATGRKGKVEGVRADDIIADDIIDIDSMWSENDRLMTTEWLKNVLLARLEPGGHAYVGGSRWNKDDTYAYLLDPHQDGKPLGGWTVRVDSAYLEDGSLLWPEKWTRELLEGKRVEMGDLAFEARYLNRPPDLQGTRWNFELHQVDWDELEELRVTSTKRAQGWDLAIAKKRPGTDPDYVACITMDRLSDGRRLIVDALRFRGTFPRQVESVIEHHELWSRPGFPVSEVAIEDNAYQRALPEQVMKESEIPVIPSKAIGDKILRLDGLSPDLEGGRILILRSMRGKEALLSEMLAFPHGKHDDLLDAMWHANERLKTDSPKYGAVVRRGRRRRRW